MSSELAVQMVRCDYFPPRIMITFLSMAVRMAVMLDVDADVHTLLMGKDRVDQDVVCRCLPG